MDEDDVKDDEISEPSAEDKEETHEEETPSEEEDDYKDKYENLLEALKETRGKSKAETKAQRQRIENLEMELANLKEKKSDEDVLSMFKDLNDDDLVTVAGAKRLVETQQKSVKNTVDMLTTAIYTTAIQVAEDNFRESHPDYDELVEPTRIR